MIGILGGMGPESTAYTYLRMIKYCQERYNAKLDSDFPPILIYSMPIPDVIEKGKIDDIKLYPLLKSGIKRLTSAGADFCIIPCNSVQGFVPELRQEATIISLVEETVKEAKDSQVNCWGILGTEVTLDKGYYQKAFNESGLEVIESDMMQKEVTIVIREILAGKELDDARDRLLGVIENLRNRGAEGIILACTDLPIVLQEVDGMKLLDNADLIAKAAIDYYFKTQQEK
jgi:aspartate racemase